MQDGSANVAGLKTFLGLAWEQSKYHLPDYRWFLPGLFPFRLVHQVTLKSPFKNPVLDRQLCLQDMFSNSVNHEHEHKFDANDDLNRGELWTGQLYRIAKKKQQRLCPGEIVLTYFQIHLLPFFTACIVYLSFFLLLVLVQQSWSSSNCLFVFTFCVQLLACLVCGCGVAQWMHLIQHLCEWQPLSVRKRASKLNWPAAPAPEYCLVALLHPTA